MDTLIINEIFYSIQGETSRSGFLQLSSDSQDVHLDVHIVTLNMHLKMDQKCH